MDDVSCPRVMGRGIFLLRKNGRGSYLSCHGFFVVRGKGEGM